MGSVNGTTTDADAYYQDVDDRSLVVVNEDGQRCSKFDDVQQSKKRNKIKNINLNNGEQSSSVDERTKKGKKKKNNNGSQSSIKNANLDDSRFVGTKLAAANEDPSPTSPTISNGGASRKTAQNGSSKSTKNDSENGNHKSSKDPPSLTPEKLHKNFQNRLLTAQLARNCHTTDSQSEFFRMLDEKIARGRDYYEVA